MSDTLDKKVHVLQLHIEKYSEIPIEIRLPHNIHDSNNLEELIDTLVDKYRLKKQAKFYLWDHISNQLQASLPSLSSTQPLQTNLKCLNLKKTQSQGKKKIKKKDKSLQLLNELGIDMTRIGTQATPKNTSSNSQQLFRPKKKPSKQTSAKSGYQQSKDKIARNGLLQKSQNLFLMTSQDFSKLFSGENISSSIKSTKKKCDKQNKKDADRKQRIKTLSNEFESKLDLYKLKKKQNNSEQLKTEPEEMSQTEIDRSLLRSDQFTDPQSYVAGRQKQLIVDSLPQIQVLSNIGAPTPSFQTNPHFSKKDPLANTFKIFSFEDLQLQTNRQMSQIRIDRKIKSLYPQLSSLFYSIQPNLIHIAGNNSHEYFQRLKPRLRSQLSKLLSRVSPQELQSLHFNQFIEIIRINKAEDILNQIK